MSSPDQPDSSEDAQRLRRALLISIAFAAVLWVVKLSELLLLGFNLFELFARLHGKLWRQGRRTLQELARQLDRALEAVAQLQPLWSG